MPAQAHERMQPEALTLPASLPAREVVHLLAVAGVHGAPVIDDAGMVVGVVSTTDVLQALDQALDDDADEDEDPEHDHALSWFDRMTARDLATPEVVWVAPTTPCAEVARLMRAEGVHRVLVGIDGRLQGVLSAFDLLALVQD